MPKKRIKSISTGYHGLLLALILVGIIIAISYYRFSSFKAEAPVNVTINWPTPEVYVTPTPYPIVSPYSGPNVHPPENVMQSNSKEIISQFTTDQIAVSVGNQIDSYAVIERSAMPPYHGGDWCVVKKELSVWKVVFCSQNSAWCFLNDQNGLPTALLNDCVSLAPTQVIQVRKE